MRGISVFPSPVLCAVIFFMSLNLGRTLTMGYVVRPAREETRSFASRSRERRRPGRAQGRLRTAARPGRRGPRSFPCARAFPPPRRAARPELPSRRSARVPGGPAPPSEWRTSEAPGPLLATESRAEDARPGNGERSAACQVWRPPSLGPPRLRAGRRPESATGRGLLGGPAALAFGRLGCSHPDSISPESVAGLRPGGSANVMFV